MNPEIFLSLILTTHIGMSENYNNIHPAFGYKNDHLVAGIFRNSFRRNSVYLGYSKKFQDVELQVGGVSGYLYEIVPYVVVKKPINKHINFVVNPTIEVKEEKRKAGLVLGLEITN